MPEGARLLESPYVKTVVAGFARVFTLAVPSV